MLFLFFMKKGLILNVSCMKNCVHKFIKQTLFKQVDVKVKKKKTIVVKLLQVEKIVLMQEVLVAC